MAKKGRVNANSSRPRLREKRPARIALRYSTNSRRGVREYRKESADLATYILNTEPSRFDLHEFGTSMRLRKGGVAQAAGKMIEIADKEEEE